MISGIVQAPADPAVLGSPLFGRPHTYEILKSAFELFVLDSVFLLASSKPIEIQNICKHL